jgi:pyruvate/2-oxoglutarate dehydrogenase complex dihydrolipoamide acyltransferase (E2) component
MKRLWLFSMAAGLLLSSATPPPLVSADVESFSDVEPYSVASTLIEPEPLLDFGPETLSVSSPAPAELEPDPADEPAEPEEPQAAPAPLLERAPSGVRVLVSIPQQKAYVFEDGELLATSPVSTGKRGHATPTGTFPILQKKVHHRSNKYANAPMPYMQRLTNYGIALHAGKLPGYPASHGCIRLPWGFAKKLYGLTDYGTKVTITHQRPKSAEHALDLV